MAAVDDWPSAYPACPVDSDDHTFNNDDCRCTEFWLRELAEKAEQEWLEYDFDPWD